MNQIEISEEVQISTIFVEGIFSAFWIRIRHHVGTDGLIEILQPDGDEDVALFEQQYAIALGFTDCPEVP